MARLKQPPRKGLTYDLSPPPLSSHTSTDAEAATQQLLAETRASASKPSKPSKPPQSSAILGANLLNAARRDFRHSSPIRMAHKAGNGRLSRVSMFAEPPRQNLARQRNIYEVPESPVKRAFRLSETVNQEPLKISRKKRAQEEVQSDGKAPSSALPGPDAREDTDERELSDEAGSRDGEELFNGDRQHGSVHEAAVPSSPPEVALGSDAVVNAREGNVSKSYHRDVQIEELLPNGAARCTAVSYRSDKPEGPRDEQCRNAGTNRTNHGLRCTRHVRKPGAVRCEHISDHDGDDVQCRAAGVSGTTRCAKHAVSEDQHESAFQKYRDRRRELNQSERSIHDDSTARGSVKRKSPNEHNDSNRHYKARKTKKHAPPGRNTEERALLNTTAGRGASGSIFNVHPEVQIPVHKSRKQEPTVKASRKNQRELVAKSIEKIEPAQSTSGRQTGSNVQVASGNIGGTSQDISMRSRKTTRAPKSSTRAQGSGDGLTEFSRSKVIRDSKDAEEASTHEEELADEAVRKTKHTSCTLDHVFEFLDLEERSGRCQTDLGLTIKRVCDKACSLFLEMDMTIEEVTENMNGVRKVLGRVGKAEEMDHRSLKGDIYCYGFRSLTQVLQSLYECLMKTDDDVMHTLDAMRIVSPLMHDILALKDTIASWKTSVPQRYKGDRIIKDIDSHLIAPLREVEKTFSKRLSQLESKERSRQQIAQVKRARQKEEKEYVRKADADVARKERRKRWQELHITRMQCEAEPRRRRHLKIIELEDLEEKDANGVKFERVPVFRNRSHPPLHWASLLAEETIWSEEQDIAVLEGLQRFAGPEVFQKIFKAYCQVGGPLRNFSVAEIIAKAMWVRAGFAKLHQGKGWEMPVWVKEMPALP